MRPATRKERRDNDGPQKQAVEHYIWWKGVGRTEYEVVIVYVDDRFQTMYYSGATRPATRTIH